MRKLAATLCLAMGPALWAQDAAPAGPVMNGPVEGASGIIHGKDHAYLIQAPKGWVLDNEMWAERGIFAVFYRAGGPLEKSPLLAYSMVQVKGRHGLKAHIKADMVPSLKGAKHAEVKQRKSMRTADGREAVVYTLRGVPHQDPEWMAFIDAPTVVILVSVNVRDPKAFASGEALLRDLVQSIAWYTDRVETH